MTDQRGFVALTSVIIVTAIAMSIALSLAFTSTDTMVASSSRADGVRAQMNADSCIEEALGVINVNNAFLGTQNLSLGSDSNCSYTVTSPSGTITINSVGFFKESTRKNIVTIAIISSDISIVSWQSAN